MALSDEFELVVRKEPEIKSTKWVCCSIPNMNNLEEKDCVGWTIVDNTKVVGVIIWCDKDNLILYCDYNAFIGMEAKDVVIKSMIYYLKQKEE